MGTMAFDDDMGRIQALEVASRLPDREQDELAVASMVLLHHPLPAGGGSA